MPRLRRPSLSFNRATFERLAYYVEVYCQCGTNRTAVADEAINKYLDAHGVPRVVSDLHGPRCQPETRPAKMSTVSTLNFENDDQTRVMPVTPKPVDGECSGVHLLG